VLNYLGDDGYARLAKVIMETSRTIQDGINATGDLHVIGEPDMSVFAFGSDTLDIHLVGDALDSLGWHPDRQQKPTSLHLMVTPAHAAVADDFLRDLGEAVRKVKAGEQAPGGRAAVYGALEKMEDRGPVRDAVIGTLEKITMLESVAGDPMP
jgi:glutamate/tyrosine decarboxylase-like PLP-dependent enzyme